MQIMFFFMSAVRSQVPVCWKCYHESGVKEPYVSLAGLVSAHALCLDMPCVWTCLVFGHALCLDMPCVWTSNWRKHVPEATTVPGLVEVRAVSQRTSPPPVFSVLLWSLSLEEKKDRRWFYYCSKVFIVLLFYKRTFKMNSLLNKKGTK